MEGPVELVVLSVKQKAARCHLLGSDQAFTFRAGRLWELVPGEIAVVKPAKQWTYAGNPYLSGAIESTRLDAKALRLVPLGLEQVGIWNPAEHYWGEEGDSIEEWAKPVIARGPRPEFEMEQVLPGLDVEDPCSDPIGQSNDLKDSGDLDGVYKILMDLCQADLRCLDAHSHLGNFVFDHRPRMPSGITKWGSGSVSYPSVKALIAYCHGVGSTTGHSYDACTASGCAFGA